MFPYAHVRTDVAACRWQRWGMATTVNTKTTRPVLAFVIIGISGFAVLALAALAIVWSKGARLDTTKYVMASVLPLVGTWVGAVLAYYFGGSNLTAGHKAALDGFTAAQAGTVNVTTTASDLMLSREDMPAISVADPSAADNLTLSDLAASVNASPAQRMPILVAETPAFVLHSGDLQRPPDDTLQTLSDLFGSAVVKDRAQTFGVVAPEAGVASVREAMRAPGTRDVFVTETGRKDGKVVGWITDTKLAKAPS